MLRPETRQNEPVPVTRTRTFRIDDELYAKAVEIARQRRETVSAVVKRALVEYVERYGKDET